MGIVLDPQRHSVPSNVLSMRMRDAQDIALSNSMFGTSCAARSSGK